MIVAGMRLCRVAHPYTWYANLSVGTYPRTVQFCRRNGAVRTCRDLQGRLNEIFENNLNFRGSRPIPNALSACYVTHRGLRTNTGILLLWAAWEYPPPLSTYFASISPRCAIRNVNLKQFTKYSCIMVNNVDNIVHTRFFTGREQSTLNARTKMLVDGPRMYV